MTSPYDSLSPRRLRRETLEQQAYEAIRSAILRGEFPDGERLVQEQLATRLGVSRIPIRDALRRLETDGLVHCDKRGAFFASTFNEQDAREVYALRRLLEPYAAVAALSRIQSAGIMQLEALLADMETAFADGDIESFVAYNRAFHMSLYEASGQRRLQRMIETLWSGAPAMTPILIPERIARSIADHRDMMKAVKEHDAEKLSECLLSHIDSAGTAIESQIRLRTTT